MKSIINAMYQHAIGKPMLSGLEGHEPESPCILIDLHPWSRFFTSRFTHIPAPEVLIDERSTDVWYDPDHA